jgi:hypothetical protein
MPDEIRGLPALPDPAGALAMISAGPVCYFLTRSGACPWTRRDIGPASAATSASPIVVRWHAGEGRVPAPPSPLDDGERAAWAHVPSAGGQLVSAMALLHVLAQATAATREGTGLLLPGGVRAVPAAMPGQTMNAAGTDAGQPPMQPVVNIPETNGKVVWGDNPMNELNGSTPDGRAASAQDPGADYAARQLRALCQKLQARGLDARLVTYLVNGVKGEQYDAVTVTNPAAPERGMMHVDSDGCVTWEYAGSLDAAGISKTADEATCALRATGMRCRPAQPS